MKEGALPTLNVPRQSANATNNRSTSAIKKRKEYSFLEAHLQQSQSPNVYKSFNEFKLRIESLALNKLWQYSKAISHSIIYFF